MGGTQQEFGGFSRLNETLTLFKTLLLCLGKSAVIFYPDLDWTKLTIII